MKMDKTGVFVRGRRERKDIEQFDSFPATIVVAYAKKVSVELIRYKQISFTFTQPNGPFRK